MRLPSPVTSYPSAKVVAEKTSQTTSLLKPESTQRTDAAGVGATRRNAAATLSPRKPITGAGAGSVISAATTNANSAA